MVVVCQCNARPPGPLYGEGDAFKRGDSKRAATRRSATAVKVERRTNLRSAVHAPSRSESKDGAAFAAAGFGRPPRRRRAGGHRRRAGAQGRDCCCCCRGHGGGGGGGRSAGGCACPSAARVLLRPPTDPHRWTARAGGRSRADPGRPAPACSASPLGERARARARGTVAGCARRPQGPGSCRSCRGWERARARGARGVVVRATRAGVPWNSSPPPRRNTRHWWRLGAAPGPGQRPAPRHDPGRARSPPRRPGGALQNLRRQMPC
eukprot:scaffold1554_cov401-Prasinococcus_capsulatus_cf.AAC.18